MSQERKIIGLVGEIGSGKDTVADYLKHRYNATLLRFSDPIKDILHMFYDRISREDQAWLAVTLKERFGKDVLLKALERKMLSCPGSKFISLNGIRYPEDYEFVRSFPDNVVLYVTTTQETRWRRSVLRHEKSDDTQGFETFRMMESRLETEQHIASIGQSADYRIDNEGSLEDLFLKIERVMDDIYSDRSD